MRQDWATARAEGQRRRMIALLEQLADAETKEQCARCGEWFKDASAHRPHCDGPA